MNRRLAGVLLSLLAVTPAVSASAASQPYVGAQYRYWSFSNHNDLRDVIVYWVPGPFHVQLETWDFIRGNDQFRPEVGLHLRDSRRSVYTLQWRHEREQERYWVGTDQVLTAHVVGRAEVSPIVTRDSTSWVYSAGFDYYWGSYNFAQATLIRDPREGGLWVAPLRARFATEDNDWIQFTIAPASRRTIGWAVDAKQSWLKLGVERNSRYDFTSTDNTIYSLGVEFPLHARP